MRSFMPHRFTIRLFLLILTLVMVGSEANAQTLAAAAGKTDNFPTAVFEILQSKTHGLTTYAEKETAVTTTLDKIVATITKRSDMSVVYGVSSDSSSSECAGSSKPYLCAIPVDMNMDGIPDDVSRMIEISFPEDSQFFKACPQCSLALPWQIAAFTQGEKLYVIMGVPHVWVRTYYRNLLKENPVKYFGLMKLASKYKTQIEKVVANAFVDGTDGFETVNQPWKDANGKIFNLGETEIAALETRFGGPLMPAMSAGEKPITPNVMMYEWTIPGTTVETVTSSIKNAFIANTVADLNQDGIVGDDADRNILPQSVMGFITANNPTFETMTGMLGMAATNIWPNGYTLQQWKVVRSLSFNHSAGRELSMIELCQAFYAGMALGFGAYHQPVLPCGLAIWKGDDDQVHVGLQNTMFLFGVFFSDVQLGNDPISQRSGQLFQVFPGMVFNELRGVVAHTLANLGPKPTSEFEMVRAAIDGWLSSNTSKTIASSQVKTDIVDQWATAQGTYQIVGLERPKDYVDGHVPDAINIPFATLLSKLALLDRKREIITYDYTGETGQISSTILNLIGYTSRNMKFGMMDWNLADMQRDFGKKQQWDGVANYPVETTVNTPTATYELPVLSTGLLTTPEIILQQSNTYLSQTLAKMKNTISSKEVKAITDKWSNNQDHYQILSVRDADDYLNGHVPHAMNIPLIELAKADKLAWLDPNKIIIVYCYTGHTGQVATTVLNLLGYKARNMRFGMMDWNLTRFINDGGTPWDMQADYPVVK